MNGKAPRRERKLSRAEYERGLPDYHDPTGGLWGAAPTYSALTPRLWLAGVGVLLCVTVGVLWIVLADVVWIGVLMFAIALGLIVDFGWVLHRKRRGEPG